ncbi:MAG: hypothetical protein HYZ47_02875 [Simkania negevensis]|nr:hypothetical protein [Simkania negevensis]
MTNQLLLLPIPSDLRSKLPDTNTPWNVNPSLFKRLKENPSSSSLYRKETLSSTDPEWEFVHHYFNHERPENRAIGAIHYIYNSTVTRQFEATVPAIEREAALPTYAPGWEKEEQAPLRKKVIQRWHTLTAFFSPFSLTGSSRTDTFTRTKILPLWHGTTEKVCDSIAQTGFTFFGKHKFLQGKTDTTSTDIGYFGSGIYFTNSAKYAAEIYSNGHLILAWVIMREPFPVVADRPSPSKPTDMVLLEGRGAYQNYNAHYIPVVSVDPTNTKCAVYYPCTDTQTPAWDELVIFQKTQALPRFWIELTVDLPKTPSAKPPSSPTLTIAAVLDKIAELLDNESVQQDTTLSQLLETRFEDLGKLDQTTPLSLEEHSFYNSISRLLDQAGKVRSFAAKQLLKPKEDHKAKGPLPLSSHKVSPSFPLFSDLEESEPPKKIPEEEKEKGKFPSLASLSLSSPKASAVPAIAFGKAAWATYFGDIGEEPPLPADIDKILAAPCPVWSSFWSGKQVHQTHLLTLVPAKVNGRPLTLEKLRNLVKSPKEGHKAHYNGFFPGGNANDSLEKNSWVLLTRDVIPDSRSKSYDAQVALVEKLAKKAKVSYAVPHLIEVATSLFMHRVRSGEFLYGNSPLTYTRCQEKHEGTSLQIACGGFSSSWLYVPGKYDYYSPENCGVGAVRKF